MILISVDVKDHAATVGGVQGSTQGLRGLCDVKWSERIYRVFSSGGYVGSSER